MAAQVLNGNYDDVDDANCITSFFRSHDAIVCLTLLEELTLGFNVLSSCAWGRVSQYPVHEYFIVCWPLFV